MSKLSVAEQILAEFKRLDEMKGKGMSKEQIIALDSIREKVTKMTSTKFGKGEKNRETNAHEIDLGIKKSVLAQHEGRIFQIIGGKMMMYDKTRVTSVDDPDAEHRVAEAAITFRPEFDEEKKGRPTSKVIYRSNKNSKKLSKEEYKALTKKAEPVKTITRKAKKAE